MRISYLWVLLISAAVCSPVNALADDFSLLIDWEGVASIAPKTSEASLIGRAVWVGNARGAVQSDVLRPMPERPQDAILERGPGRGPALAYTKLAEFVKITPQKIDAGPIFDLAIGKLRQLGATNIEGAKVASLAHVDLDGDGRPDIVLSARTQRDRYGTEKPGDIEAIFLVVATENQPEIIDQIMGRGLGLVSIARNPVSGSWNLLVFEIFNLWHEKTFTKDVMVAGQITQQTKTLRRADRAEFATVYELRGRKLNAVDGLSYRHVIGSDY